MSEFWHDAGCAFHRVSASDDLPAKQLRQPQLRRLKVVARRAYATQPGGPATGERS